jgi:hypothetical protein
MGSPSLPNVWSGDKPSGMGDGGPTAGLATAGEEAGARFGADTGRWSGVFCGAEPGGPSSAGLGDLACGVEAGPNEAMGLLTGTESGNDTGPDATVGLDANDGSKQ